MNAEVPKNSHPKLFSKIPSKELRPLYTSLDPLFIVAEVSLKEEELSAV